MTDKVKCEYCGSANFADSIACHACSAPMNDVEKCAYFVDGGTPPAGGYAEFNIFPPEQRTFYSMFYGKVVSTPTLNDEIKKEGFWDI